MEQAGVRRRLAAILSADVVGYSRLMGVDEEATLGTLGGHREAMDGLIAAHHGRVVGTAGDSVLAEFASVVEAVRCAAEIQREIAARNDRVPDDRKMAFRIGLNLGDVMVKDGDIFGDGVNVAARLESLAEPGGICISGAVFDQVKSRSELRYEDLGERRVKNIAEPVRVYRVRMEGESAATASAPAALDPPENPSIAVLAFDNMSDDPEHEYFADGIAEDIITALSKVRWLLVIARNSSFAYKGTSVDLKRVGRELGVRYVLEGSVRKAGNRVRVTAQLIETEHGKHVWADRYDLDLEDIFAVQDAMTQTVVAAIEPELGGVERERARRKPPESLGAWDCHQRGLWHMYKFTRDDNAEAARMFRRAVELDLSFAPAFAGLAYVGFSDYAMGYADSPNEALAEALRTGKRAVALDNKDPFARWALGRVQTIRGEHESAIAQLETAIDLNPNYAHAYFALGFALTLSGKAEDAIGQIDKAMRLSPHDPFLWAMMHHRALAHLILKQHDEAADWATRAARQPNAEFWPYSVLAASLGHLGRTEEAQAALGEATRMNPDYSADFLTKVMCFQNPADIEHYFAGLRKAGLPQ